MNRHGDKIPVFTQYSEGKSTAPLFVPPFKKAPIWFPKLYAQSLQIHTLNCLETTASEMMSLTHTIKSSSKQD